MALPQYIPSYTVDDYRAWEGDWELWSGVPVSMSPSPSKRHQALCGELHFLLKSALKAQGCDSCQVFFELDWIVAEDTVFRPDLMVVCDDVPSHHLEKTPILVAEVLSPSTRQRDLVHKKECYQELEVLYYLVVDPQKEEHQLLVLQNGVYQKSDPSSLKVHENCEISIDSKSLFTS